MSLTATITRSGKPALWVGGGSFTNTCTGRWVIRPDGSLPPALFIARTGPLSCSTHQALVPLRTGDYVCGLSLARDTLQALIEGQDIPTPRGLWALRVDSISPSGDLSTTPMSPDWLADWLASPQGSQVALGLGTYHNRSGDYFVAPQKEAHK